MFQLAHKAGYRIRLERRGIELKERVKVVIDRGTARSSNLCGNVRSSATTTLDRQLGEQIRALHTLYSLATLTVCVIIQRSHQDRRYLPHSTSAFSSLLRRVVVHCRPRNSENEERRLDATSIQAEPDMTMDY
jgi:hypothetical protein